MNRQDTINRTYAVMVYAGVPPETAGDFCTLLSNAECEALYRFCEFAKLPTVKPMWFDYSKQEYRWDMEQPH